MPRSRTVAWDGFANARDLGGLPTTDRRVTRVGRLYRSGDVGRVRADGWEQAWSAGVRTVLDLRNDDEVGEQAPLLGGRIAQVRVTLDDAADVAMWARFREERLDGTPLYLRAFLELKPERCAAAITAIARSAPGGLVFHCAAGRDRTGLVALLLLALAEVDPAAIVADYERSAAELPALFAALGRPDESAAVDRAMAWHGMTVREAMLSTLEGFDAGRYLLDAGVAAEDLATVRGRLRSPSSGTAERAGPDDVEPAVTVWRAANVARGHGPTTSRIARVREKLRDPDACLVVLRCGDVVAGMALVEPGRADEPEVPADRTPYGHVSMLFVDPQHWGRGYGAALLGAVHQVASERGWTTTSVWTRATNARARGVYERAGYRETGRASLLADAEPILQYARSVPSASCGWS